MVKGKTYLLAGFAGLLLLQGTTAADVAGWEQRAVTSGLAGMSAMPAETRAVGGSEALRDALGFAPLALPAEDQFAAIDYRVISGVLAQISYTNRTGVQEIIVRKEALRNVGPLPNISGLTAADWQYQIYGGSVVSVAADALTESYAAAWHDRTFAYAVMTRGVTEATFKAVVSALIGKTQGDVPAVPNPVVVYGNLEEVASAVGFRPLTLPAGSHYRLVGCSVISGVTAQAAYKDYTIKNNDEFFVRKARYRDVRMKDISGLAPDCWQKRKIGRQQVVVGSYRVGPNGTGTYAAYWRDGDYVYAAFSRETTAERFVADVADLVEAESAAAGT